MTGAVRSRKERVSRLNLANALTMFRIVSVPFLMVLILADTGAPGLVDDVGKVAALFLTIIAGITDVYDGIIARSHQVETTFGRFCDPVADKLLITTLFVAFVDLGLVAAWIVIVMLCREFSVLGLRMLLASEGTVMSSTKWAKFKTVFQVSAAVAVMLSLSLRVLALSDILSVTTVTMLYYGYVADYAVYTALVFTIVSGLEYFVLHWKYLE